MKSRRMAVVLLAAWVGLGGTVSGEGDLWPGFNGPHQDNKSADKGLLKSWPAGGPRLLWRYGQCGIGYSTVTVAGNMIFTSGNIGNKTMVIALTMEGRLAWQSPNQEAWTDPVATAQWKDGHATHPGARSTPVYSDGMVYQMNGGGRLAAFDAKTGKEAWFLNLQGGEIGGAPGTWGYAESVTIDGDKVICTPGGSKTLCIALDKKTGKGAWSSGSDGNAAFVSGALVDWKGVRMLLTMSANNAVGIDARTGRLLWRFPHSTWYGANVNTPVFNDGYVYLTSGYGTKDHVIKLNDSLSSATEVWSGKHMDNMHGGVVLVDGYLYGSGDEVKGWHCIEMTTGKDMWTAEGVGKSDAYHSAYGSVTYADGMLYCVSETGIVALVEATSKGYRETGRFKVPSEGKDPFWNHPVVAGGRLYIRHQSDLLVYSVKK